MKGQANTRLGRLNTGVPGYEIFISNVSFDSTANDVVNCFRHCGPILRWYFPRKDPNLKNSGKHKGYGFIYFKTI